MLAGGGAAVAYVLSGLYWLHWLALHLALLGGVSQLVLGAGQFFTCAFLATDPPPRRLVGAQLATWNAGTVLVAAGVSANLPGLVEAGAALLGGGLTLFAIALRGMDRRSLQKAPWALRWYQASATSLAIGGLAGVLLARQTIWPQGDLLGAHLALTLAGWLGTAILGTLHTFFPSLTQTQLRHPRLQLPTYLLWLAGVAALAAGAAFAGPWLADVGWAGMLGAAALLTVNLVASLRTSTGPLALPPRLLACAQTLLVAGLSLALVAAIHGGVDGPFTGAWRSALAALLLVGWIGLTVVGALLHLLAILARIRRFAHALPRPQPGRDRVITAVAGAAVTLLALSRAPGLTWIQPAAESLCLTVAAAGALHIARLAVRALRPGRGRSAPGGVGSGMPAAG